MDWKEIVGSVAPVIGTALMGPMAGSAIKMLSNELLADDADALTPQQIEKQLANVVESGSTDVLVKVKELDQAFAVQMKNLDVDVFKLKTTDKQHSRTVHKDSQTPAILVYLLTAIVVAIIYLLFYVTVPQGAAQVLYVILGAVLKEWGNALQYWYGATREGDATKKLLHGGL